MTYVVLLRGVNVGKAVRVPMKDLKTLLEELGFTDVVTYLNSGNAVFRSTLDKPEVTRLIEGALEEATGERIATLAKTADEMAAIADVIPGEWGSDAGQQTYVAYLFDDVDCPALVDELPVKKQFMSIFYTPGAIVWNIERANYNRSQITRIAGHRSYSRMTTRNVNTARKLAAMAAGD